MNNKSPALTKFHEVLLEYILPCGLIIVLTGMFWIGERSYYHKAFYAFLAIPTLISLIIAPATIQKTAKTGIFLAFMAFSFYTMLSIAWSGTDDSTTSLLKRPLYISMLFFCTSLIALNSHERLEKILLLCIGLATISALISIIYYLSYDTASRLPGYRALYNPLLTSHVYGMFTAMAAALLFISRGKSLLAVLFALTCLSALLLLTGSRTPLLALTLTFAWLTLLYRSRRAAAILACTTAVGILIIALYPENITSRGLSYRPEIWHQAWLQITERPWLGYGYEHSMIFWITGVDYAFADPHNMELAILFSGGVIGLTLWLTLYVTALLFSWRNRTDHLTAMASAALVFGFAAGLTEGNAFMSRPKEHWFLIWIPFALIAASWALKLEQKTLKKIERSSGILKSTAKK